MSGNPNDGKLRRQAMTWERDYTLLPNPWIRDKRLSFTARGILAWLQSHDVNFEVTLRTIAASGTGGLAAARAAVNELEAYGYLRRYRERRPRGRLGGTIWEQLDPWSDAGAAVQQLDIDGLLPITKPKENPSPEPTCDSPTYENRTQAPTCDSPTYVNRTTIEDYLEETSNSLTGLTYDSERARDIKQSAPLTPREQAAIEIAKTLPCPAGNALYPTHYIPPRFACCVLCELNATEIVPEGDTPMPEPREPAEGHERADTPPGHAHPDRERTPAPPTWTQPDQEAAA